MRKSEKIYKLIIASIIATGISSIANQILIIREFLSQFHGNEITISVTVFSWLIIGGAGSLFSSFIKKTSIILYSFLIFLISILPLIQLILIRLLKNKFFIYGASVGFYPIFLYIFSTIFLYSFLIGFILPYSQKALERTGHRIETGHLYILDNIGDIAGGAMLSFFLIYILKPFSIIAITSIFLILISLLLFYYEKRYIFFFCLIGISTLFFIFSLNRSFETMSLTSQYGKIINYKESPYGRIIITKEDDQYTLWESGTPIYFEKDIAGSEEKVHYALSQLNKVRYVLLISGGFGKTIKEIQKYHPEHIDYIELDPFVTELALRIGIIKKAKALSIINTDGRYYIKHIKKRYDAIIVDLSEPDTFQTNRFFTKEFFSEAKRCLTKDGILSINLNYSPNYMSLTRKKKVSILYNTLSSCFSNVLLIPGQSLYFIASDKRLYMNIPERLKQKGIKSIYIKAFFYGNITPDRIRYVLNAAKVDKRINTDFKPCLVSIMFKEWFEKFHTSAKYFFVFFLITGILYLALIKKEEYVLFSTGFSLMGLEMLIIFTFQIIYGYVYLRVGAIITMFLLGLLPGSIFGIRVKGTKKMLFLSELMLLLMLFFYLFTLSIAERLSFFFFLYPFFVSSICGFQFPVIARIISEQKSPASRLFAADLIGAAFSTILIGVVLIPLYGIKYAIISIVLFKIISIAMLPYIKERQAWN